MAPHGTAVTGGRQPLVVVPWAFTSEPGSLHAGTYVAFIHDARGILWYFWKQVGGGPVNIGLHSDPTIR